jgi:hypothetical protein
VLVEELAVDDDPRDEDHDLQVEEHEEERGDVELDREARVHDALAGDAALVGRVLDLGVLARWPSRWLAPMTTPVSAAARTAWIRNGR